MTLQLLLYPLLAIVLCGALLYFVDKILPGLRAAQLPTADRVIVHKAQRSLTLLRQGEVIKRYRIALGGNPEGHKQQEGDSRTPEGKYMLDWRNPNSRFHLSIHISYPNEQDRRRAGERGVAPGGAIMIHGRPNWLGWWGKPYEGKDWTDGCVAVSNVEMEEIWRSVPNGTPITLLP